MSVTPLGSLRREIDRLFDEFGSGFWRSPFRGTEFDITPLLGERKDLAGGAGCRLHRYREDPARSVPRGNVQEGRAHCDAAEKARGPKAREEDRGQGCLTKRYYGDLDRVKLKAPALSGVFCSMAELRMSGNG
jgi:hypothetical protein